MISAGNVELHFRLTYMPVGLATRIHRAVQTPRRLRKTRTGRDESENLSLLWTKILHAVEKEKHPSLKRAGAFL